MGSFATDFSSLVLLYVYGATGSFHLDQIATPYHFRRARGMAHAGVLLILVAMALSSAVQFHFLGTMCIRDHQQVVTSFMSTVVEPAATAAFFRLFILLLSCFTKCGIRPCT
ncbi:MAG: hypothetical protein U0X76_00240 [Bacteroidia bacterium]